MAESERVRYSVSGERCSGPTPSQSAIAAIPDVGMTIARKATLIMPPRAYNSHARSRRAVCCCTPGSVADIAALDVRPRALVDSAEPLGIFSVLNVPDHFGAHLVAAEIERRTPNPAGYCPDGGSR